MTRKKMSKTWSIDIELVKFIEEKTKSIGITDQSKLVNEYIKKGIEVMEKKE